MGKVIKDTLNIVVPTGTSDKDDSKTSNSNVLPSGGATGQVLAKKSDNDLDTLWQTVSGGGAGGGVETVNSVSPDGLGNVALTQDSVPDGTTYKRYSQTEKTKLSGIATGAQVNTSKVKASATDTTEGYLGDKIVAGTNVTITKNNSGGNETYTIASTASDSGVTVYADLATIKAVDTTAYTTVQTVQVTNLGLYKFQPASTLVGDDVNVITPTTGSSAGRWILQSIEIEEVSTTINHGWSTKNRISKINNRYIKTGEVAYSRKFIALGSSVMLGYCSAGNFEIGKVYTIDSSGTTNFTLIGAASNLRGTIFTATGIGTGTGTAYYTYNSYVKKIATIGGWEGKVYGNSGETSSMGVDRFYTDVVPENPDIVWLGYSPNNNGLLNATTIPSALSATLEFEKGLSRLVKLCKKHGYEYIIAGVYPANTYTALGYEFLKELNIKLSKKYKGRYLNILDTLDAGTGIIKASYNLGDGHLNSAGHSAIAGVISNGILEYTDVDKIKKLSNKNGIILGSDTSTALPLQLTTTSPEKQDSFSIGIDIAGSLTLDKTLIYMGANREVNLTIDTSGYYVIKVYNASVLSTTLTTTIKPKITSYDRVLIVYDRQSQFFNLYINGVLAGSTSVTTNLYFSYLSLGGGITATNNATGVKFRNLCKWVGKLNAAEALVDSNGTLIESGLEYFNSLETTPSKYYANMGIDNQRRLILNSTLWTLATDTDNLYTDTEKTKLATINTVGAAVASATTIVAPSAIFHVTGTTAISTITIPYTGFVGQITIIPDGAFTLATGGNIAEAYTAVVNRAIVLTYDGTSWYRTNN